MLQNGLINKIKRNSMKKENLESEFIPYLFALWMQALGFDEPCLAWYYGPDLWMVDQKESKPINYKQNPIRGGNGVLAPTWRQAFKWFRDEYNLYNRPLTALRDLDNKTVHYNGLPSKTPSIYTIFYDTYEEAELACLEMLLDIVETKIKEDGKEDNII
jgi:hypothetical protein